MGGIKDDSSDLKRRGDDLARQKSYFQAAESYIEQ